MPLLLTDSRWSELRSCCGSADDVVAWLREAQQHGRVSEERLGDLINEVQHQRDTCTAMYAVAPYLVKFARNATPQESLTLLTHAGLICASATKPGAVQCPEFLNEDFAAAASTGATRLTGC